MLHPTLEETARFFDAIARRYDRSYAPSAATTRARMASLVARLPPRGRVLDLGIGTGRELPYLLDAGFDVVGVDIAPNMIALCNQRRRTVPIVRGDFYAPLPFEDGAFDAAIALFGTLAHPPDEGAHARLAKELRRVVRDRVVLEVPSPLFARNEPSLLHEDNGARIIVVVPSEDAWRRALEPYFTVAVERPNEHELVIIGS